MSQESQIGVTGLAVMGANLARNIARHGVPVAVHNRTAARTAEFIQHYSDEGTFTAGETMEAFVAALERPRRIVVMVKAGAPVDGVIDELTPLLDQGDIIIDAGNSHFADTRRRTQTCEQRGLRFMGIGVSGGEEGALLGPSIMPGGPREAYAEVEHVLTSIAAQVDGTPCCTYVGPDGAGHYVKMVHNGIEYADMQLIGEAYWLLRTLLNLEPPEIGDVFAEWNKGVLDSYLVEISADVLRQKDPARRGRYLVDSILDAAGQKGTGKWTSVNALDTGVAAPTIAEAVFARIISALKDERLAAAKLLKGPAPLTRRALGPREKLIEAIRQALYCSKVCAYAQGFQLMREAQKEYGWTLDFATIARIWRGGCIIRARFLQRIAAAYAEKPDLANLLLDRTFRRQMKEAQDAWRRVVSVAALAGVPCPAFMSALAYYDSYRSARLPANLLQAQRDYFGSHTYERIDQPRGALFHLDWSNPGRPQLRAE